MPEESKAGRVPIRLRSGSGPCGWSSITKASTPRGGRQSSRSRRSWRSSAGSPVRIANWRHGVWQPAANEIGRPAWATPYVLRHTAASLLAQRGVPVSAVAAALGHDPAMFLRTYAHLYPGGLGSGRRCDDVIRSEVTTELLWSAGDRESSLSRGENAWTNRPARRARTQMPPDLHISSRAAGI